MQAEEIYSPTSFFASTPFICLIVACAAASLATATLYGEALT
jgi:hypothetical protein